MRRWLFIALLAAVTAVSGVLALRGPTVPAGAPARGDELAATPSAAVLSPRRVPQLLHRTVADARLHGRLQAALADPAFAEAEEASCLVVEQDERVLFSLRPGQPVIPASTLKVLTGLAAVERLGAAGRFTTEVRVEGPLVGGVAPRLWLVGGGDPLLATADYVATFRNQPQVHTPLEVLADRLVAAGIREVPLGVAGDGSRFDAQPYLPTWKAGYLADNEIGPLSGLLVNDGFATFGARRTRAASPAGHAAAVLTGLLRARGVVVGEPGEGRAPDGAALVASLESPTMAEVVGEMLSESDNLTAEALVKELGHRFGEDGSWAAGLAVVRDTLAGLGLPVDELVQRDGSGLERENRLTCGLLMAALDELPAEVEAGFAVAGRTGTLNGRFAGSPAEGRVRAKTGSLDHVAGLVGFAESGAGVLEFAFVGNGLPRPVAPGRDLQRRVAEALVAYPEAPAPADLAPPAP